jgi:hypothetical protein
MHRCRFKDDRHQGRRSPSPEAQPETERGMAQALDAIAVELRRIIGGKDRAAATLGDVADEAPNFAGGYSPRSINEGGAMSLRDLVLADLVRSIAIVRSGHEVAPAWRILTPHGDLMIVTPFDRDKPDQRERAFELVPRFMAWKLATAFVFSGEIWLGPEEAVIAIGVSHRERMGVIRRIRRTPGLLFMPPEWLLREVIDATYLNLLPSRESTVTPEEAEMLKAVFGRPAR